MPQIRFYRERCINFHLKFFANKDINNYLLTDNISAQVGGKM